MKKNFFCKLPFIHTASSPAGKNLVCCEGNGDGSKLNDGVGPYDFLNSKFMNEIRNGFLSENPLENKTIQNACENCIVSERKFGDSKRLRDMSWKMHQDPDDDLLKKNIARQKKGMPIETISNIHLQFQHSTKHGHKVWTISKIIFLKSCKLSKLCINFL